MNENKEISDDAKWIVERSMDSTKEFTKTIVMFPSLIGILAKFSGITTINLSCWWIFVVALIFITLSKGFDLQQFEKISKHDDPTFKSTLTNMFEKISVAFVVIGYIALILSNMMDISIAVNNITIL